MTGSRLEYSDITMPGTPNEVQQTARFAGVPAGGAEARPEGLVAGEMQSEFGIPPSTLSHHLDKSKNEGLVSVRREGTHLWYAANTGALREQRVLLHAGCRTRIEAIRPEVIIKPRR